MLYLYNLHTSIARNKKSTCTLFVCAFVEKKAVFFFQYLMTNLRAPVLS